MTLPPQDQPPQMPQPHHPHYPPTGEGMYPQQPQKNRATGFLLVLCILTFVGSGFAFLSSLVTFFTSPDQQLASLNQTQHIMDDAGRMPGFFQDFFGGMMEFNYAMLEHYYLYNGLTLLTTIGLLIGAILMLKLQRKGFLIYTISSLVQLVLPLILIVNYASITIVVFGGIFSILFVVLYSMNLKHMR